MVRVDALAPAAVGEGAAVILPDVAGGPRERCKLRDGALHGGEQRAAIALPGAGAHVRRVAVRDGFEPAVLPHLALAVRVRARVRARVRVRVGVRVSARAGSPAPPGVSG